MIGRPRFSAVKPGPVSTSPRWHRLRRLLWRARSSWCALVGSRTAASGHRALDGGLVRGRRRIPLSGFWNVAFDGLLQRTPDCALQHVDRDGGFELELEPSRRNAHVVHLIAHEELA